MSGQLKLVWVGFTALAVVLGGCGEINSDNPPPSTPHRSQPLNSTDSQGNIQAQRDEYKPISLDEFEAAEVLQGEEPQVIALATFGDIDTEGGSQQVTVEYPQSNHAVVTVTQTGIADDSVGAIRYRVELEQDASAASGKEWQTVWMGSQFKCQPNRGHQDWSKELCL